MLTIISGGQTGVDQAALEVAHDLGFPTGGTAPLGYRTEDGPMPELLRDKYGLKESWSPAWRVRTMQNVMDGDLTVWFGVESPGGRLTIESCGRYHKPHRINPTAAGLLYLLTVEHAGIQFLNVAGNRASTHPSSAIQAREVLRMVLRDLSHG
jgi:hypothetical protein